MKRRNDRRYGESNAEKLLLCALELSSNGLYTSFRQLAKIQDVHRKTYLHQSRKYNGLGLIYDQIKKNLERNILIEIESGLIGANKGRLMLWNHNRK